MVFGGISKFILYGVGAILFFLFAKEAFGKGIGATLGSFGGGVSALGSGAQTLLTGIGAGSARLLDPLFSLVDVLGKAGYVLSSPFTGGNTQAPAPMTGAQEQVVTPNTRELSDIVPSVPLAGAVSIPTGAVLQRQDFFGIFGREPRTRLVTSELRAPSAMYGGVVAAIQQVGTRAGRQLALTSRSYQRLRQRGLVR